MSIRTEYSSANLPRTIDLPGASFSSYSTSAQKTVGQSWADAQHTGKAYQGADSISFSPKMISGRTVNPERADVGVSVARERVRRDRYMALLLAGGLGLLLLIYLKRN